MEFLNSLTEIPVLGLISRLIITYIERRDYFLEITLEHINISLIAILCIFFIGVPLGILISRYRKLAPFVISFTNFLYTIPVIAFFGIMVSIIGLGTTNAILALIIYGLLPVVRNTYVGITEVDKSIIEAAQGMGSTRFQLLFNIQLPLALPVIIAGLRTMIVMTIAMTAIAAFIGAGGIGTAIWRGISTYNTDLLFAGSILVALLAIIADRILEFIEKIVIKKVQGKNIKGGNINV
ncbi:ABC transporter permease [Clostridium sp. D2Q-11]|uniref:ABC transporter permease n=1 Tax=Anaeromonas frigoriresistens TaxID=2683708 RepID=A0A942UTD3_9FIRM|nr:ABC transporter permease [Anaeromonas frigoriresistens]MBS4537615.1 ABC transporter permease [Anaeromonas frigoriresistens]